MNTKTQYVIPSLLWVEVTVPNYQKYWARTSRFLADTPESERAHVLELLKAGRLIAYEESGVCIQCVPITGSVKKRLDHLLSFEEGSFRLATFRADNALFSKDLQEYYSMNEMAERSFMPSPTIAIGQWNTPVYSFHGQLTDVFVPVELGPIYFHQH
ncbi:hypothetical protein GCM10028805_54250 [Spirosoma harenae]